jgi:hypothetical protein
MITKDEFKEQLKTSIGTVKFRKVDQSIREMSCTLSEKFLPEMEIKEDYSPKIKTDNPNNLRVWDLDKQAWRAFRLDSVIEYSFQKA